METFLAFDIGLKRTGVAVGQRRLGSANPAGLLAVKQGQFNWQEVDEVLSKWQPDVVVIGNPKSSDPHLNKAINRFKSHIQKEHKIKIIDFDETLSTNAANQELHSAGLNQNQKTKLRDQVAACLILESYFETLD